MSQAPLAVDPRVAPWDCGGSVPAAGLSLQRLSDWVALTKPRIAAMSLATVAAGFVLGAGDAFDGMRLLHALAGAAAVAAGAGALNQVLERRSDALMRRTAGRPLPSGRLRVSSALLIGATLCVAGITYLSVAVNGLAGTVAAAIAAAYLLVYTPLKRRSTLNTAVGAVSGALPPMLGWVAARGTIAAEAWILFLILFLWQFPHFLAIAWIHREDYARAGMRMLPTVDRTGAVTAYHALAYCLALLPVSLLPSVLGVAGVSYFMSATLLGLWLTGFAVRFVYSREHARGLLRASLVYLPLLLGMLCLERSGGGVERAAAAPSAAALADSPTTLGQSTLSSVQP